MVGIGNIHFQGLGVLLLILRILYDFSILGYHRYQDIRYLGSCRLFMINHPVKGRGASIPIANENGGSKLCAFRHQHKASASGVPLSAYS